MTFILAFVWGRGVLITADSRSSVEYLIKEERKIYPITFYYKNEEFDLAVITGSGDAPLLKQTFEEIKKIFEKWFSKKHKNPNEEELIEIVKNIESYLVKKFNYLRETGITPELTLLLASVTRDGKPKLYKFDSRGLAEPLHENPGFALIGSGMVTGGLLLLKLLNYSMSFEGDRGLLSSFMIDVISEVDATVSPFLGDSVYIRWDEKKKKVVAGALKEEAIKEYKQKIKWRRKLIEVIWLIAERLGEKRLTEILYRISKNDESIKKKIDDMKKIIEE
jgi:20S proteasome alpha/beta subunit